MTHEYYMKLALTEAEKAFEKDEGRYKAVCKTMLNLVEQPVLRWVE